MSNIKPFFFAATAINGSKVKSLVSSDAVKDLYQDNPETTKLTLKDGSLAVVHAPLENVESEFIQHGYVTNTGHNAKIIQAEEDSLQNVRSFSFLAKEWAGQGAVDVKVSSDEVKDIYRDNAETTKLELTDGRTVAVFDSIEDLQAQFTDHGYDYIPNFNL